jgi:hypothetical protein
MCWVKFIYFKCECFKEKELSTCEFRKIREDLQKDPAVDMSEPWCQDAHQYNISKCMQNSGSYDEYLEQRCFECTLLRVREAQERFERMNLED